MENRNEVAVVICPECGSEAVSCPGGTCYKPSEEAMRTIKYLCTNGDCLNEFGDEMENKADLRMAQRAYIKYKSFFQIEILLQELHFTFGDEVGRVYKETGVEPAREAGEKIQNTLWKIEQEFQRVKEVYMDEIAVIVKKDGQPLSQERLEGIMAKLDESIKGR